MVDDCRLRYFLSRVWSSKGVGLHPRQSRDADTTIIICSLCSRKASSFSAKISSKYSEIFVGIVLSLQLYQADIYIWLANPSRDSPINWVRSYSDSPNRCENPRGFHAFRRRHLRCLKWKGARAPHTPLRETPTPVVSLNPLPVRKSAGQGVSANTWLSRHIVIDLVFFPRKPPALPQSVMKVKRSRGRP
jgi:hypothetical protein